MANLELILQGATKRNHAQELRKILTLPKLNACLVSVAFVRTAGIDAIRDHLIGMKPRPRFFVGIRNDITSVQAMRELVELGVELYAVDTAARRPIFHPKLFISRSKTAAKAVIGSANLTHYGLYRNIEAGTMISLDLSLKHDLDFTTGVFRRL
jgi:HKD family nuclease